MSKLARSVTLLLVPVCMLAVLTTAQTASAQQQQIRQAMPLPMDPEQHTNAVFLDRDGEPVYLVANLQVVKFLGCDVLFGNFTDGEEIKAWYLTPSFSNGHFFWIAANGPAGVVRIRKDAEHPIRWEDNQGNKGFVITF